LNSHSSLTKSQVTVPLDANQTISNKEYVYQYMVDALSKSFATLSKGQTANYIQNLFGVCQDFGQFRVNSPPLS